MSSSVLIFDPQGIPHDVPYEKMHEAVSNGGTPGVRMTGDDGQIHAVPATKIQEAYQHGGKMLPLEQQETDHPGFWHAVGSYFARPDVPFDPMHPKFPENNIQMPTPEENAQRKAQGLGPTYRALVPMAEGLGMNVKGAEQAASRGDVGGVAGYAAVPAAAAVAPLVGEAAGKIIKPVAGSAGQAVKSGVSTAARVASDIVDPDITGIVSPRLAHVQRALGRLAKTMDSAGEAPVYRDATIDRLNIPEYAGEDRGPMPAQPSENLPPVKEPIDLSKTGGPLKASDFATKPPAPTEPVNPALKQAEALRQPVHDIVDKAIPPSGKTQASNLLTKSRIDFQLQRGNVEAAQAILDSATPKSVTPLQATKQALKEEMLRLNGGKPYIPLPKKVIVNGDAFEYRGDQFYKNGKVLEDSADIADAADALGSVDPGSHHAPLIEGKVVQPKLAVPSSQFPPEQPISRGTTNDIRAQLPENVAARRTQLTDDKATAQEMNWNLERHGWQVESEARKEFIARNSTGMTKGELIRQSKIAQPPAGTTVPGEEDMTEILSKSLAQAKARKQ